MITYTIKSAIKMIPSTLSYHLNKIIIGRYEHKNFNLPFTCELGFRPPFSTQP